VRACGLATATVQYCKLALLRITIHDELRSYNGRGMELSWTPWIPIPFHSLGPSTHGLPFKPLPRLLAAAACCFCFPCLALPCLRKPVMNFLSASNHEFPIVNYQHGAVPSSNSSIRNGHPSPFNLDTESQSPPENSTSFRAESVPLPKRRHQPFLFLLGQPR
jgi:hypothetical protein